jgi:hypothetical protein
MKTSDWRMRKTALIKVAAPLTTMQKTPPSLRAQRSNPEAPHGTSIASRGAMRLTINIRAWIASLRSQ